MRYKRPASEPSILTFRVEKLDVTCHKFDGPICNADSLLYHKNSVHHVDKAVLESTFAHEFDAITLTNCLRLGRCVEVNLVEGNKVFLVVRGCVLSLFECFWYSRSECFECCCPGRHYSFTRAGERVS